MGAVPHDARRDLADLERIEVALRVDGPAARRFLANLRAISHRGLFRLTCPDFPTYAARWMPWAGNPPAPRLYDEDGG